MTNVLRQQTEKRGTEKVDRNFKNQPTEDVTSWKLTHAQALFMSLFMQTAAHIN